MITPEDLRTELDHLGMAVTSRTLTDWRTKGLLPPLQSKGLGKGRGAIRFWGNPEVITQAALVHQFLEKYAVADAALLKLWTAGYEVSNERAKECWLSYLRAQDNKNNKYANKKKDGFIGLVRSWITRSSKTLKYGTSPPHKPFEDIFIEYFQMLYDPGFIFEADLFAATIIDKFQMEQSEENYSKVEEVLLEIEPALMKTLPINSAITFVDSITIEEMENTQEILRIIYLLVTRFFELTNNGIGELQAKYYSCNLMRDLGRLLVICLIQLQREGIEFPILKSVKTINSFANTLSKNDIIQREEYKIEFSEPATQQWNKTKSELKLIWTV